MLQNIYRKICVKDSRNKNYFKARKSRFFSEILIEKTCSVRFSPRKLLVRLPRVKRLPIDNFAEDFAAPSKLHLRSSSSIFSVASIEIIKSI